VNCNFDFEPRSEKKMGEPELNPKFQVHSLKNPQQTQSIGLRSVWKKMRKKIFVLFADKPINQFDVAIPNTSRCLKLDF
jgi:hypothetical protein